GFSATAWTAAGRLSIFLSSLASPALHTEMDLSALAAATSAPLPLNATAWTVCVGPAKSFSFAPPAIFQRRTTLSPQPVKSFVPSGLTARQVAWSGCTNGLAATMGSCHALSVPSSDDDTI